MNYAVEGGNAMGLMRRMRGLRTRIGFCGVSAICLDSMYVWVLQARPYLSGGGAALGQFVLTNKLMTLVVACFVFLWPAGIWVRARVLGAPRLWSAVWVFAAVLLWCVVLAAPGHRPAAFVGLLLTQVPLAVMKGRGQAQPRSPATGNPREKEKEEKGTDAVSDK